MHTQLRNINKMSMKNKIDEESNGIGDNGVNRLIDDLNG